MTDDQSAPFNWTISESATWPPKGRPKPPFGPTTLEVMRSCPLRCCFEASRGYERQMGDAARIGIAFHRTMQSLTDDPPRCESLADVAAEAKRRFTQELAAQDVQKAKRPREHFLPRNEHRVQRATEASMLEAQRLWKLQANQEPPRTEPIYDAVPSAVAIPGARAEVSVQSQDGLLYGRIDYIERTPAGVRLLDFKSALRDDVPDRYERQLQLYAYLWHETYGEWPLEAELVYPFTSSSHQVRITPDASLQVATDSLALISRVQSLPADRLATPGEVCQVCEFRPWCRPFWQMQSREPQQTIALDRAFYGMEGKITEIKPIGDHMKITMRWRNSTVTMVLPLGRFPQLEHAIAGDHIRALGIKLRGQRSQPQGIAGDTTEIFIVRQ